MRLEPLPQLLRAEAIGVNRIQTRPPGGSPLKRPRHHRHSDPVCFAWTGKKGVLGKIEIASDIHKPGTPGIPPGGFPLINRNLDLKRFESAIAVVAHPGHRG
jgi:hypothetical protein